MESKLLIKCHVQQDGILLLRQVVIGFGTFIALTPKLSIDMFPDAVQQWLSIHNPSDLSLQPSFRSARDQLRLYLNGMRWQHMQKRYFLLHTSGISSNASCIMLSLRPLTQRTPFSSTDVERSSTKLVRFWTAVTRGLLVQNEMNESLSPDLLSVLALVMWILSDDQV